jgi:hypothetical protein
LIPLRPLIHATYSSPANIKNIPHRILIFEKQKNSSSLQIFIKSKTTPSHYTSNSIALNIKDKKPVKNPSPQKHNGNTPIIKL